MIIKRPLPLPACAHLVARPAPSEATSQPFSRPRGPRGHLAGRPPLAARSGRRPRPRSEDWCKRLRLAAAMGLQTSGTVVMGRLQSSGTRGGASTLRSERR
jgi:hypothetical protein